MTNDSPLAQGRAAQILDAGPGLVVKRSRSERTLAYEANAMELVRAFGVPVPKVHDMRAGDREIVMERIEGPTMLQWIERNPLRLRRAAAILGELGDALHEVIAPTWLRDAGDGGDRVLHLDLHPLNVLMARDGPVLIDWANTARGAPATDDALTWVLLATGEPEERAALRHTFVAAFRRLFVRSYLARHDPAATRGALAHAASLRLCDPNLTEAEAADVRALLTRHRAL